MDFSNQVLEFFNSQINTNFIFISLALYGMGILIRSSKKISNELIPTILIILGFLIHLVLMLGTDELNNPSKWVIFIITAFAKGILSALCSSGIYSILRSKGIVIGTKGLDNDNPINNSNKEIISKPIDTTIINNNDNDINKINNTNEINNDEMYLDIPKRNWSE